jgi:hypothetical protein
MKKIFLFLMIAFLLFPFAIFSAGGSYQIEDSKCTANYAVKYTGMVPCGRCLEVASGGAAPAWYNNECGSGATVGPNGCGISIFPPAKKYIPCTMCHFFIILNDFSNFLMLTIIPPIMILVFSIGGIAFYMGGQSPQKAELAKKILTSATIGFVLIYGSWFIVNLVLTALGVADWTGLGNWFQITCKVIIK